MTISPLAAAALRVINAAWVNGTSYDLASQAAYALESAQMLQSPETAAETERLRARVTELVTRPSREAVREVADAIDAALIAEPQQSSAVVLQDLLIKARRLLPCTCARSGGLHEQSCLRYVPGHELISPALALKAYRAERPAAASGPTEVERLRARVAELEAETYVAPSPSCTRCYGADAVRFVDKGGATSPCRVCGPSEVERLRARVAELEQHGSSATASIPDAVFVLDRRSPSPGTRHILRPANGRTLCGRDASLPVGELAERSRYEALPVCGRCTALDADRAQLKARRDAVSPWQRAVDGLNSLASAGIGFHIEPDGHISNPAGDEHIEWDRTAERWQLVHDEDDAETEPHPAPCRWPASPDCTCAGPVPYALTPQATSALAQPAVDKLRGILAPPRKAGA